MMILMHSEECDPTDDCYLITMDGSNRIVNMNIGTKFDR